MPLIDLSFGSARVDDQPHWRVLSDDDSIPPGERVLVSPTRAADLELSRDGLVGLVFAPSDEVEDHAQLVANAPFIAVNFPKFTDGRGYSSARLLRGRLGYEGPLRATGDVLPDQVFYMARVGFDQLELRADQSAKTALQALEAFSVRYQGSHDTPPLFRVRG